MGSNSNKSKFLGMPYGTANGRLRKLLLFSLACRLGEDVCCRCQSKINTVEEFSIEHIKPWENIDIDLFWDLGNIAFSHMRCNIPHTRRGGIPKACPDGMAWCVGHKDFLDVGQFHKHSSRHNGRQKYCKACHNNIKGRSYRPIT